MDQETKQLLSECDKLIASSKEGLQELDALNKEKEFVLNEWKSGNKHWFREEPGHTTTEDVIKMCIEYAWAARGNYEYQKRKHQEDEDPSVIEL